MKNLLSIKIKRLEGKINLLQDAIDKKIKHQKKKLLKLYNLTNCHIYKDVLDHYYLHLNCLDGVSKKDKRHYENYDDYHSVVEDLGRLYMTLSWFEQFLSAYRKIFIEPKNSGLSEGIKSAITDILYNYSLRFNKKISCKGINITVKNIKKYFESIVSVANTTPMNLGLGYYIERNYILDIGNQRSKYSLPEYDIEEVNFNFRWNVEEALKKLNSITKDINKEDFYSSFEFDFYPNTGKFDSNAEIIAFVISENIDKRYYGYEFTNGLYFKTLESCLKVDLNYDLYALDLLYFFFYTHDSWDIRYKLLGMDVAREQFCFNVLNLIDTDLVEKIFKEDKDKYDRHKLTCLNETGYNVNKFIINEELLKCIKLYLHDLKEESNEKLEKTLRSLYNVLAVRSDEFGNVIL